MSLIGRVLGKCRGLPATFSFVFFMWERSLLLMLSQEKERNYLSSTGISRFIPTEISCSAVCSPWSSPPAWCSNDVCYFLCWVVNYAAVGADPSPFLPEGDRATDPVRGFSGQEHRLHQPDECGAPLFWAGAGRGRVQLDGELGWWVFAKKQCFGSIFIESGSSKKSQSGSRKALNPDPSYFFTLSEKKLNYVIIISFYYQKKSIKQKGILL